KRAALRQFWTTTPNYASALGGLGTTTVGTFPQLVESDRADLWMANFNDNTVSRVRASDGKLLDTWTGATHAFGVLVAMGRVFVAGGETPGGVYLFGTPEHRGGGERKEREGGGGGGAGSEVVVERAAVR